MWPFTFHRKKRIRKFPKDVDKLKNKEFDQSKLSLRIEEQPTFVQDTDQRTKLKRKDNESLHIQKIVFYIVT